jgi:DNA-binding NarL/FixJ family response regulator
MQDPAPQPNEPMLGVAVHAPEPARRAALEAIVVHAGFALVDVEVADVVLAEGAMPPTSKPVLILADHEPGRDDWLPASADARQIRTALAAVAAGLTVRPRSQPVAPRFEAMHELSARELLTPRELEILHEIGAGRSNKSIARALGISLHTVKFHIESVLRKLGARTRAEAVAKALERRTQDRIDV